MAGLLDWLSGNSGAWASPSGGLMGALGDPNKAAALGFFNGLLQASGPSRIPINLGQELSGGMQGATQGLGNALQMQRQMYTMQALQNAMGGQSQPQSQPQGPMGSPVSGPANSGPMSGPSAGMGSYAGYGGAQGGSSDAGAPAQSGASIFGSSPQQLWQKGFALSLAGVPAGADMMKMAAQYDPSLQMQQPTDAMKMAAAAYGYGTPQYQQALTNQVANAGAMSVRPGGGIARGNQISMIPQAVPGFVAVQDPSNPSGWTQVAEGNGQNAISAAAAAKAGGEGSMLPYAGVDANGNPLPVTNRTAAATQGNPNLPLPLRNNNPGAVSPGGGPVAQYPDLQTGLQAMDQNLASYAGQQGTGTLGGVITKWVGSAPNAPAYIKDVTARLGVGAGTPVDLTNPAQRQAIATAIMLHENGPSAVFRPGQGGSGAPAAPAQGNAIYAAAPMGASTFAQGQVQQMQSRWNALRDQNSSAQTVVSQLQNISSLAPAAITGAEADKRAYVNGLLSLVGVPGAQDSKTATDLLDKYSNQIVAKLGQGGLGTDAARSIVSAGNPNAHMTVPAIQEAVRNLSGQYQMVQAKAGLLQQYANGNDPAGYTKAETTFDQNADPRIWQYQSIQDPVARQKFAAGVLKQDPKFGQKIQALEQIGALQ